MRSLIKGHRRSDSSTSDLSSPIEQTLTKVPPLKSNASPIIPGLPLHMTPPQAFGGLNQSSMSSPKKLLTPIKKMFGHHGKNGNLSATVDSLNSVVFGEFEPPKGRKPIGANSLTNLSELKNSPHPAGSTKIHGYKSLSLLEAPTQIKFEQMINPQPPKLAGNMDTWSDSSHEIRKYGPKKVSISLDAKLESETGESHMLELVTSKTINSLELENKTTTQGSHMVVSMKNDSETLYEADDDLRDSDNSSQFSFVKDMVGGRNTSIKYYKTKSQMKRAQPPKDYLGMEDLALDDEDAHSDYDFENNGLDDDFGEDDFGDDGFEANDRFQDFLSEESAENSTSMLDTYELKPPAFALSNESRSNSSNYMDEELDDDNFFRGSSVKGPGYSNTIPDIRSPGYGDDFLDAYLDKSRLPMPTTSRSLDLSLPIGGQKQTGLTNDERKELADAPLLSENSKAFGLNIISRRPSNSSKGSQKSLEDSRKSITDMMGILASLESKPSPENEPAAASSVLNIMGMLEKLEEDSGSKERNQSLTAALLKVKESLLSLERTVSAASPQAKAQMRQSIADMMSTLSILDTHLEKKNTSEKYKNKMSKKPFNNSDDGKKRYSWFNESEKVGTVSETGFDNNGLENLNGSLDQDLIDEINMLPEDYDFDDLPLVNLKNESGFYRSNSYNKKPERVIKDFKYQDNKIHTPLKTVTFYRGNSEHSLNAVPSRMGSNKSMTSYTSVEDQDFDLQIEMARKHMPLRSGINNGHSVHVSSPLYFMSSDSISRRSENLEPIDESDLASI